MILDKKIQKLTVKNIIFIITYIALLALCIWNFENIIDFILQILRLLRPFFYGLAMAFIFYLPFNFFQSKLSNKKHCKLYSTLLSILLIVGILICILQIVLPHVAQSIDSLITSFPSLLAQGEQTIIKLLKDFNIEKDIATQFETFSAQMETYLIDLLKNIIPTVINTTKSISGFATNFILSFAIAIYFIVSKDKLIRQLKIVLYAFLPEKTNTYLLSVGTLINKTFSNFISGQLLEAVIIGVLNYIGCLILQMPYAPILSVIIACTNIIPIFGPIIGTFICAFLIFFVNPIQALIFIIFGIVLQQFEANIIYPRVVGTSIGLSGLWVLFAITIGAGLFGFVGMILGLPTFAVICALFKERVQKRLQQKQELEVESSSCSS